MIANANPKEPNRESRFRLRFALFIALQALATGISVSAQTKIPFEQEWTKLIAAAQQEATLAIASGGQPSRQYRPVLDVFAKKFGVKVEMSTGSATDTVNRVLAERKAGKVSSDVALISSRESTQRLVPDDALAPFAPVLFHPEVLDTSSPIIAAPCTALVSVLSVCHEI